MKSAPDIKTAWEDTYKYKTETEQRAFAQDVVGCKAGVVPDVVDKHKRAIDNIR